MHTVEAFRIVNASPEEVWDVLADTSAYPRWNPFIKELVGDLVVGTRLSVSIAPPGGKQMRFRPTLTTADRGRRLEWLGKLGIRGIFDGRHEFLLEALGEGSTKLTQRESFSGALVPLMPRLLAQTQAGFQAMNAALAREVAARAGQPVVS